MPNIQVTEFSLNYGLEKNLPYLDVSKGKNTNQPMWVHILGEVLEVTETIYNYSRMPEFTASRLIVSEVIDFRRGRKAEVIKS